MIDSVLLIRPKAIGRLEFPFGLLYVGAALKAKGYKVRIIDLQANPEQENEIIEILTKSSNTILGINALAPHYRWVKRFSLKLKKIAPQVPIVIGGHIAVIYEMLLLKTGVDYVCLGEGEELLPELIEKINQSQPLSEARGMAYIEGGKVIKTEWRSYVKDYLMPDYGLIDVNLYLVHPSKDFFFARSPKYQAKTSVDDKLGAIMFSRGCVGACGFCYRHLPGFRQGSIEWSWNHLKLLYDKYGVKYFRIDDELFTNNPEWFKEFYQRVVDSKIDILFRITGLRVDSISDEQLKMLKEMGCVAINYGIESGSQEILDKMNKRTTVEQNLTAIKKTLAQGMQVMIYIIFGYEGENKRTLKETLSLLLKSNLSPEYISIFYAVALPGTKLYRDCLKDGEIKEEERYLEELAPYIEEKKKAHEYYLINLSELELGELVKWKEIIILLVGFKQILRNHPIIFKILKKAVFFIPLNKYILKLLSKLYRVLNRLQRIINEKKKASLSDNYYDLIKRILYRTPNYARLAFYKKCKKLLSNKVGDNLIFLLSFDCDNFEDIKALPIINDFLNKNQIKATFAVPGEILLSAPEEFLKLYKKGHEFIGHGYKRHSNIVKGRYFSTLYYHKLKDQEIEEDIVKGNQVIRELFGKGPAGFRIPHFSHSNTKKELLRVYKILKQENVNYSSSGLPFWGILKGPLFKTYYSIYELPVSGGYYKPLSILDTYSYGFSKYSNQDNYKDYLDNIKKNVDYYLNKKVCFNLYCDPSQAVQMEEWFKAIKYAKENGYKFITLGNFYERYK